jgi:hypothetical protein
MAQKAPPTLRKVEGLQPAMERLNLVHTTHHTMAGLAWHLCSASFLDEIFFDKNKHVVIYNNLRNK